MCFRGLREKICEFCGIFYFCTFKRITTYEKEISDSACCAYMLLPFPFCQRILAKRFGHTRHSLPVNLLF